jgi:hypothetical protein
MWLTLLFSCQFPDINKLCNVASCWIYSYIGILLGAQPILHISRIRVKFLSSNVEAIVIWILKVFAQAAVSGRGGREGVEEIFSSFP